MQVRARAPFFAVPTRNAASDAREKLARNLSDPSDDSRPRMTVLTDALTATSTSVSLSDPP
jgi:hypothetical protein